MTITEFNAIPTRIAANELSKEEAVQQIILFFKKNLAAFNISNFDEDYVSEMIVLILSKIENVINTYDISANNFFTYIFTFIKNVNTQCKRKKYTYIFQEDHKLSENVLELHDQNVKYSPSIKELPLRKVPYSYKKIDVDAFQQACKNPIFPIKKIIEDSKSLDKRIKERLSHFNSDKLKKMLLAVTLKSSFYLDDKIIDSISEFCECDRNELASKAQALKADLYIKEQRKIYLEERRNNAYYNHKKYAKQIQWMMENPDNFNQYKYEQISRKYLRNTLMWKKLNKEVEEKTKGIRPSNKAIANLLGICERQVSYYIKTIRDLKL